MLRCETALPGLPDKNLAWFIPGISPITTCDVHREVLVDAATGLRVAQDDGTRALKREINFYSGLAAGPTEFTCITSQYSLRLRFLDERIAQSTI